MYYMYIHCSLFSNACPKTAKYGIPNIMAHSEPPYS